MSSTVKDGGRRRVGRRWRREVEEVEEREGGGRGGVGRRWRRVGKRWRRVGKRDGDGEKGRAIKRRLTLAAQVGSSSYSHGLVPAGNDTRDIWNIGVPSAELKLANILRQVFPQSILPQLTYHVTNLL